MRERMIRAASRVSSVHAAVSDATKFALGPQDHAIVEDFERIRCERAAGRGDIDDQLRRAGRGGAFGRAEAFDNTIVGDVALGEKMPREIDVFGRDTHPLARVGREKATATSSRSAMVRTSIHACGTATMTLAWPKPSGARSSHFESASGMLSRTRSSPVTPRCAVPAARCVTISDVETKATSTLSRPAILAPVIAGATALHELQSGARKERGRILLQTAPWRGQRERAGGSSRRSSPPIRLAALRQLQTFDPDRRADGADIALTAERF